MFKNKYPGVPCESRAVSNEEVGNDIYPPAKRCLDRHNIPYTRHHARRITQQDYENFDVIYVMDNSNLRWISRIVDDHDHKIKMLCSEEVDDPWYTGDFDGVFYQIDEALNSLPIK